MSASIAVEELYDALDERTLHILESRQKSGVVRRRGWLVRRALVAADIAGLAIAFLVAEIMYGAHLHENGSFSQSLEFVAFAVSLPLWIVAAKVYGLYDKDEERTDHSTADDFVRVFHLLTVGTFLLYAGSYVTSWFSPQFPKLFLFWVLAILTLPTFRVVARGLARRSVSYVQNTIIVGAGDVGQLLARKVLQHKEYGLNLVGFVDDLPKSRRPDLAHLTILGSPAGLPEMVRLLDVERVIVAFSTASDDEQIALVRSLRESNVQIDIVPRLFDVLGSHVDVHEVEGLPVISLPPVRLSRSSRMLKRSVDVLLATVLLVALSPLFAFIAARIWLERSGPVFFRQTRLGIDQKPFTFLKFRSMHVDTNPVEHADYIARSANGVSAPEGAGLFKLDQSSHVTGFGRWLRRSSFDELPQLVNVFRGEMSMVGPRPCLPYELDHFEPHHFERFNVPAGITGLWQVTARAHATFREALDMDVTYVRSWSLGLDCRLLARTPLQLLRPGTR